MASRRAGLCGWEIDKNWPHQVALPERQTTGRSYVIIRDFCRDLSLCKMGHTFFRGHEHWNVFCFAEREHAELFQKRFGGEWIDPKTRPKWGGGAR